MSVTVQVCPLCNRRTIVRVKGTFATHYRTLPPKGKSYLESMQCPGSRVTPAQAEAWADGVIT